MFFILIDTFIAIAFKLPAVTLQRAQLEFKVLSLFIDPDFKSLIIPTRDPKLCLVPKRKADRIYNHQWRQTSRTRPTLVVKRRDSR